MDLARASASMGPRVLGILDPLSPCAKPAMQYWQGPIRVHICHHCDACDEMEPLRMRRL